MKLFDRLARRHADRPASPVQTAPKERRVAGLMSRYTPLMPPDARLYRAMREAIPVVDAAIDKIVRLIGDCEGTTGDAAADRRLADFLQSVPVGPGGRGMRAFLSAYTDQLLTYGTAVGEMVLSGDGEELAALYNAALEDLSLEEV